MILRGAAAGAVLAALLTVFVGLAPGAGSSGGAGVSAGPPEASLQECPTPTPVVAPSAQVRALPPVVSAPLELPVTGNGGYLDGGAWPASFAFQQCPTPTATAVAQATVTPTATPAQGGRLDVPAAGDVQLPSGSIGY